MAVTRSHSLSIGIVGLPNSGKSTLFNALTHNSVPAENYPFCTIDKNVGVVRIDDQRLDALARMYKAEEVVPSAMTFVDIAGLVKGASEGEGLGNKFLGHIREVNAIMYVLRAFRSDAITHVYDRVDPVDDFEILQSELIFKDMETVERRIEELESRMKSGTGKDLALERTVLDRIASSLDRGSPARTLSFSKEEEMVVRDLWLLTMKPSFYILNVKGGVDEELLGTWKARLRENVPQDEKDFDLAIDSKMEAEMEGMPQGERNELMGMVDNYAGVENIIELAYKRLDLVTFYTGNEKMCTAWTIRRGATVKEAAGVIHSDLEEGFVAAEVADVDEVVGSGGWNVVKEAGHIKSVGKEYVVGDGDYIVILANR